MLVNSTSANNTSAETRSSNAGLTVGLTLLFLLLVTVALVMTYLFKDKCRFLSLRQSGGTQTKQDYCETPQTEPHQYVSPAARQPPSPTQNPVYENLGARKPAFDMPAVSHRGSDFTNDEDLYLQCEPIYGNDPECNLVIHHEHNDEDVYIVPES